VALVRAEATEKHAACRWLTGRGGTKAARVEVKNAEDSIELSSTGPK